MTEEFLHYIWKNRLLTGSLETVSGEALTVIYPGEKNTDGGPDFFNARIRIGTTTWVGNVEIHIRSEDWFCHKHHLDPVYDNVILHVVFSNEKPATFRSGSLIPALVVEGKYPGWIYDCYRDLQENQRWVPCEQMIRLLDAFVLDQWSPALCIERMEEKMKRFSQVLTYCRYDWEETFYILLVRSFGFRVNAQPIELLGKSLSIKILEKHRNNLFQMEALLFGQAGMLRPDFPDDYPKQMQLEFEFLRQKYQMTPINGSLWKFLRMRPSNFPTLRIAQLAVLFHRSENLFSFFLQAQNTAELRDALAVKAGDYWNDHYLFGKVSPHQHKMLGPSAILLLIVNFVVPFLFFYGDEKGLPQYKEKGIQLLEELPAESNEVLSSWKEMGICVPDALHAQALLQLKTRYCDRRRCLQCRIGRALLTS